MNMLEQSVGKLARNIPGATQLFHQSGIDFCCGGQKTLAQAITHSGASAQEIVAQLERLEAQQAHDPRWEDSPDAELIDHLLERYHEVHRNQLAELVRMAERVEQVHGDNPSCPRGLAQYLRGLKAELEQHMMKEENILFPLIKQGKGMMATGPIMVMRSEHDEHALAITGLQHLTNDATPPKGACNTWRALYKGIEGFIADLKQHIHLENNVLFERQQQPQKSQDCCGHCS
jgi:regulator of cell morphogenesis and NO signaling